MSNSESNKGVFEIAAVNRKGQLAIIHHMMRRDWTAIVLDIVAAINFGNNVKLQVDDIDCSGTEVVVKFQSNHDAKMFTQFCDERNPFK